MSHMALCVLFGSSKKILGFFYKQRRRLRLGILNVFTNIRSTEELLVGGRPFGGRGPSVEDDLRWKRTFGGRQPSVEEDLWWKMTFNGR